MVEDPKQVHYLTKEECKQKSSELKAKQEEDTNFMIELRLLKDEHGWYADVPGHTRGQNSMVCGADILCENMAHGDNEVIVKFRTIKDDEDQRKPLVTLKRMTHSHAIGATYLACGATFIPFPAYICNVMHSVCGTHWKRVYVHSIEHHKI